MKKYSKKIDNKNDVTQAVDDEEKIDLNSMEVVVERVEGGLIGTLRIDDDTNKPIFKKGDFVLIRTPSKLSVKDFVLYVSHEEYYLRRIIKFVDDDIYVAGDNEKAYRIISKEDIVGKVLSRERKNKRLSFSLSPRKKIYTFKKVNLAYFRLKKRIMNYEQEINNESLELAMQSTSEIKNVFENKTELNYTTDLDLDSDLRSFINPDTLVLELRDAMTDSPVEEYEESDELTGEYVENNTEHGLEESNDEIVDDTVEIEESEENSME